MKLIFIAKLVDTVAGVKKYRVYVLGFPVLSIYSSIEAKPCELAFDIPGGLPKFSNPPLPPPRIAAPEFPNDISTSNMEL